MKIVQAPTKPIQALHRFNVAGVATPDDAGKPLVVSIDNNFKMTGPPVSKDGTWRLDLIFPRAGSHHLSVSIGDRRVDWAFQVIGDTNEATVTNLPEEPSPGASAPPGVTPAGGPPAGPADPASTATGLGANRAVPIPVGCRSAGAPTLYELVEEAYKNRFSDLHVAVGREPRFRHRGSIQPTSYPLADEPTFYAWLSEILSQESIQTFVNTLEFDGAAQYPFARVRVNLFQTLHGPAMALRLVPLEIPTFEQLNLPSTFGDICHGQKGLVLVTGPTGSGKSTTLAAMVDYINRTMPRHILTIEDPIEFVHQSQQSIVNQREIGIHSLEFSQALRASLREDPDVILIGEMRDRETLETALKAAQTGHLVFGTLHTSSAVKTLERVLAMYGPDERGAILTQLSESLLSIIAQGLVPTTDGKRAPFYEVLRVGDAVRDYIRKDALDEIENLIPRSRYEGMCTMNQTLYQLYLDGRINEELALEYSPRQNEMAIILRAGDPDASYHDS